MSGEESPQLDGDRRILSVICLFLLRRIEKRINMPVVSRWRSLAKFFVSRVSSCLIVSWNVYGTPRGSMSLSGFKLLCLKAFRDSRS